MTDLIIHIGTFKTGTTALQKFLSLHRARILSESSVLFPRSAEIPAGGHHNLVYEITGSWKYVAGRGGFSELAREIEGAEARTVLISAENLSAYALGNPEVAPRFVDFAKEMGMRPKVLCYVRPQWEYIDSYYSQGVKSGYTTCSFDEFVGNALCEDMYDYEKVISPWDSIVDDIEVRPYSGGKLVQDVCDYVGVSFPLPSEVLGGNRRNERFGSKQLEFMRHLGAALERARTPFRVRIPLALRARQIVSDELVSDVPFTGLSRQLVQTIHENFRLSNERLSEKFNMGESWFSIPDNGFQSTAFNMSSASPDDIAMFEDIVVKLLISKSEAP